jgi:protein-L-isoaspartate(D-aspartate) O-methyltransferase
MENYQQLIDRLKREAILKSPEIIAAFTAIDRKFFVGDITEATEIYCDAPLSIGHGQTISQPKTVAIMLEELQPKIGDKILDIGTGSGWATALLAEIIGKSGFLNSFEIIPQLAEFAADNLARFPFDNIEIRIAEPNQLGMQGKLFDKILVSAAARDVPKDLLDQLAIGGRMVLPVKNEILIIDKLSDDNFQERFLTGFAFVPLIY